MKTLTAKEAAQAVLEGKTVQARYLKGDIYIIKSRNNYIFACKNNITGAIWGNFIFNEEYTYTFHEEPKQEEKRYRWFLKNPQGEVYQSVHYQTKKEVLSDERCKAIARLDCLDDLKDEPYYTEEF